VALEPRPVSGQAGSGPTRRRANETQALFSVGRETSHAIHPHHSDPVVRVDDMRVPMPPFDASPRAPLSSSSVVSSGRLLECNAGSMLRIQIQDHSGTGWAA
jgi:hypothetical protein